MAKGPKFELSLHFNDKVKKNVILLLLFPSFISRCKIYLDSRKYYEDIILGSGQAPFSHILFYTKWLIS